MDELEEETGEGGGGGFQAAQIKSYLAFARRAIGARWRSATALLVVGVVLTFSALVLLPKTFECKTVIMALGSPLDRSNDTLNPLAGAEGLIMSHENLTGIIHDTGLVKNFDLRRPAILRFKDRIMGALLGKPDDETKVAILVGTLETKLLVTNEKGQLMIAADWSDGETAARLAEAARESFLKSRHTAEISAFEDKMAILDGHATKLRDEVGALADQLNADEQVAAPPQAAAAPGAPKPVAVAARPARPAGLDPNSVLADDISTMKEKLAADKPKLADLENDWSRKQRDEQAKLADLKLRFTPNHPEVVTEEERVAMLSQVPSQVALMRSEVATLEQDIKGREALVKLGNSTGVSAGSGAAPAQGTEPLPTAVIQALTKDDTDPALRAQLSGAIMKYRELRDDIRTGRIELDTAQAAFNHRYQLVVPAEVPSKPIKPKPALIVAAGLLISLLLAGLVPILGELRRGIIVETWQVHHLQLPVLAELELPPHTD